MVVFRPFTAVGSRHDDAAGRCRRRRRGSGAARDVPPSRDGHRSR
ncbi:hypothetical protein B005_4156 [Nocardiopsis alba ATCC BAA-2165]|uniref:Uncharacterized protein n=1 Tax=Nocardiopsis alba (strain ATCC BAA-2165 / BE74) TaxID=1205910 RepID=J7LFS2_NOCAA|nr:hypothetical protein B005_4156 [Nocardiopsis alba ATCC BAA-2165]